MNLNFMAMALLCALTLSAPSTAQSLREREIAQCLPGEISTWGDGHDRPASSSPLIFQYDHTGSPAWFSQAVVLEAVQNAAQAWSQFGVPSQVLTPASDQAQRPGAILVQWSQENSGGNFAQADLGKGLLAMNPAMFELLNERNPTHDAGLTLQMVISHEMGHHFGLMAHSRRCVDVTSYYDNGKGERCHTRDGRAPAAGVEYRALLPTACDIARCMQANNVPERNRENRLSHLLKSNKTKPPDH